MTSRIAGIAPLIAAVELKAVRLISSHVKRIEVLPDTSKRQAEIQIDCRAKARRQEEGFVVAAEIAVSVRPKDEQDKSWVTVEARFDLEYGLPKGMKPTPRELKLFAETNGIFNAWPYWREFVQSTSSRMNVPQIVLPPYRLKGVDCPPVNGTAKGTGDGSAGES
jgi:preprotein translocase subunit SecB